MRVNRAGAAVVEDIASAALAGVATDDRSIGERAWSRRGRTIATKGLAHTVAALVPVTATGIPAPGSGRTAFFGFFNAQPIAALLTVIAAIPVAGRAVGTANIRRGAELTLIAATDCDAFAVAAFFIAVRAALLECSITVVTARGVGALIAAEIA